MNPIYPWLVLLLLIPIQLYFFYFIATYVRKRVYQGPFWAKVAVIVIFIGQIPMLFLNIINLWRHFS